MLTINCSRNRKNILTVYRYSTRIIKIKIFTRLKEAFLRSKRSVFHNRKPTSTLQKDVLWNLLLLCPGRRIFHFSSAIGCRATSLKIVFSLSQNFLEIFFSLINFKRYLIVLTARSKKKNVTPLNEIYL